MKTNENMQKDAQEAINKEPLLSATEEGIVAKIGMHVKKIILFSSLAGIGLFFYACAPSYVASQPAYVEYARPSQPSSLHVWIDGDWKYSRQTHSYERRNGYWEKPNQGRTYVSGHWQSTPRGQYWVEGHWQRQDRQRNNDNR